MRHWILDWVLSHLANGGTIYPDGHTGGGVTLGVEIHSWVWTQLLLVIWQDFAIDLRLPEEGPLCFVQLSLSYIAQGLTNGVYLSPLLINTLIFTMSLFLRNCKWHLDVLPFISSHCYH